MPLHHASHDPRSGIGARPFTGELSAQPTAGRPLARCAHAPSTAFGGPPPPFHGGGPTGWECSSTMLRMILGPVLVLARLRVSCRRSRLRGALSLDVCMPPPPPSAVPLPRFTGEDQPAGNAPAFTPEQRRRA
jgi:hypothetical protein